MTETTNLADDEKLSKLLQNVFKKESILTESELKSEVKSKLDSTFKMILDSALKKIHPESDLESELELEIVKN